MAASMLQQSRKYNNQINKDKVGWILDMILLFWLIQGRRSFIVRCYQAWNHWDVIILLANYQFPSK